MNRKLNKLGLADIHCNYFLRKIVCFVGYRKVLKIVNYNKKIQSKLNLNNFDYEKESNNPKYEIINSTFSYNIEEKNKIEKDSLLISIAISFYRFFYLLGYYYYGKFFYFKSDDIYIQKCNDVIIKIEKNSFVIIFFNIIYFILVFNLIGPLDEPKKFSIFDIRLYLNSMALVILCIINYIFFGFCVYRFILYFKIYGMINPLIIVFELICYLFQIGDCWMNTLIVFAFLRKNFSKGPLRTINKTVLNKFNDIKIIRYKLPENLITLPKHEIKKFVLYHFQNFECYLSIKQYELIRKINIFRKENDIPELSLDKNLPLFTFKKFSDMEFNKNENFFELIEFGNTQYIFKYPIDKFEIRFNNKEHKIIKVLLKDNIKFIQICSSDDNEYIIFKFKKYKYNFVSYNDVFTFSDNYYKYHLIKTETII